MKISQEGINFIKRWEGCILHPYRDVVGVLTIGYGHTASSKDEIFPNKITLEQAEEYLRKDLARFEKAINDYVKVPLTQNQYNSLCSFAFNCGTGALQKSSLLIYLNRGEYQKAADELPKWSKAGGKFNQGLFNRRNQERKVFLTPDPVESPVTISTPPTQPIQPETPPAPEPAEVNPAPVPEPTPEPQPVAPAVPVQPPVGLLGLIVQILNSVFKRK